MTFAHSRMLWLLSVTLPLLTWFLWWSWRKRQKLIAQFIQSRLRAHLTIGVSTSLQKIRRALLVLAVGLLILTLARPQWGFAWEEATQRGLDIVVAIDTSRSMLAEDLPPNRLTRAKLAALDLMRLAKNDRLGLVAFAGTAFLQCPLTLDDEAFRQSVEALDVGIIPEGGSVLREAITTALGAFKDEGDNHKILVLFSDGEDHDKGALEAAQKAAEQSVRIFTVGVGTPNGELLRQRDQSGTVSYIKDEEGNVVKSRLNEDLLTQVATAAHGFYLAMSGAKTVDVLYERGLAPLPKSELSSKLIKRFHERYYWPLTLAILLLLLELFLPDRKRPRRTEMTVASPANAALQKAAVCLLVGFGAATAAASPAKALRQYEAGQFKEARQEFLRLLERHPEDAKLHYNAGAAAYQAGEFEQAAKHFSASRSAPDLDLQQRAYYNLGNSFYRLGELESDPAKKLQAWEQSAQQFESALKLSPQDTDSQFNLEFVKKKLEELKKQQSQSPNPQQNKDGDKQDPQDEKKKQESEKSQQENPKDAQPKPGEDKKEGVQNQPDENKDQQQKQQEEPAPDPNKAKDEPRGSSKNNEKNAREAGEKGDDEKDDSLSATSAVGQMTMEQVKRLLDALKGEERIFIPKQKPARPNPNRKDW